jgi:hypothetical protein
MAPLAQPPRPSRRSRAQSRCSAGTPAPKEPGLGSSPAACLRAGPLHGQMNPDDIAYTTARAPLARMSASQMKGAPPVERGAACDSAAAARSVTTGLAHRDPSRTSVSSVRATNTQGSSTTACQADLAPLGRRLLACWGREFTMASNRHARGLARCSRSATVLATFNHPLT